MAGENKSTDAEVEMRINIVMEMLLSGLKRWQIIQNINTNEKLQWGVKPRMIDEYISSANQIISEETKKDRSLLIAQAYARYDFIYQKLINVKDYKGAIAAIEKGCNLLGLNAPAKIEATGKDGIPLIPTHDLSKLTFDELKALESLTRKMEDQG